MKMIESKSTIIRFHSRSTVDSVFENKKKLRNLDLTNPDLLEAIQGITINTKFFIRASLCPYYKNLAYNCRLLKRNKIIHNTMTSDDGSVKILIDAEGSFEKLSHIEDLKRKFPHFQHFSFQPL